MADINEILANAAQAPAGLSAQMPGPEIDAVPSTAQIPTVVADKKAQIIQASADKKARMATPYEMAAGAAKNNGTGFMSEYEADMRFMDESNLTKKYGAQAGDMILQRAAGNMEFAKDASAPSRPLSDLVYDNTSSTLLGLTNAFGGIGALGAGLIDKDAGAGIADGLKDLTAWTKGTQSETLQGMNRIKEAKIELDKRDSDIQFEKDLQVDGEFMASLSKIGRDFLSSADSATDDATTLVDGTANAIGSLFAAGPVAKGIGAIGSLIVPASTRAGVGLAAGIDAASGTMSAARAIAPVLDVAAKSTVPLAIGAIEGGGAYQQITSDIMGRDHERLMEESPMYRELLDQGMNQEDARTTVANRTGQLAAAITAPLAAATGTLVSKFEGSPMAAKSVGQIASNLLREPVEEGIQGGTGQLAQNYAEQQNANTEKRLADDVGRQIAEGSIYGLGMAAAVQAPNLLGSAVPAAALTAGRTVAKGAGLVGDKLAAYADQVKAKNDEASPIADDVVATAAAESEQAKATAEPILRDAVNTVEGTPEQKAAANAHIDKMMTANTFDPGEVSASLAPVVAGATNRVEAIQALAEVVKNAEPGSREALTAGLNMYEMLQAYEFLNQSDESVLDSIPADHQASKILKQFDDLMANVQNTPSVIAALNEVNSILNEGAAPEISEATLQTQEGMDDARNAVNAAALAPEKADLATNEKLLFQISQGNLKVTPAQKAALDMSTSLLRAAKAADEQAVKLGQDTKADRVSRNIRTEVGAKGESALQHARNIYSAWNAGDLNLATARMRQLENFAQSQINKLNALNSHFATGNPNSAPVKYQTVRDGEWFDSVKGVDVVPTQEGSVKFAQRVAGETQFLADVYNGLVDAFPDLGGSHVEVTPLDAKLNRPVKDVVSEFKAPATVVPEPAPVVKDETPSPQKGYKPEAVILPTPVKPTVFDARGMTDARLSEQRAAIEALEGSQLTEEASNQLDAITAEQEIRAKEVPAKVEAAPVPKGLTGLYPDLVTPALAQNFKLPAAQKTRTLGSGSPLQMILDAFKNEVSLDAFMGGALSSKFTPEISKAYRSYLSNAEAMTDAMHTQLTEFLGQKYSKSNPTTFSEIFLNNTEVLTKAGEKFSPVNSPYGKILHITELNNGELIYNPELIEMATLAAMQWALTADNMTSTLEPKDVAKMLGMEEEAVTPEMMESLGQGMSPEEAKRSLASKIIGYWGVTPDANGYIGIQQGIAESVAAEYLRILNKSNAIEVVSFALVDGELQQYQKADGKPQGTTWTRDRILMTERKALEPLKAFPSAIEEAVLVQPEDVSFIGEDARPPVAQTQLRNQLVDNTPEQVQAIKNEQETPYYVHPQMAGLWLSLGSENLVNMFGAGQFDTEVANKNHAESMEGVNRGISSAFLQLRDVLSQVANKAEFAGTSVTDTPIRYAFNMTRVGRLQMLGRHNPQANKIVREAILPTRSTLDLSSQTGEPYQYFGLAMAQGIGLKVHKQTMEDSLTQVHDLLEGPLKPAVDTLTNWLNKYNPDTMLDPNAVLDTGEVASLVQAFKDAKKGLTPVALHSVMEYARYKLAEDKSAFTTSLYVEADGVTNGPINAMVLFTPGAFTKLWIENIAKGGLYINKPGETVNSHNRVDKKDMYETTTDVLRTKLNELSASFAKNPTAREQSRNLMNLMDEFLDGQLRVDEDGNLTLDRGIAKNPLTITIYGSGAQGIAAKMVKSVVDAIYERMTDAAVRQAENPELSLAQAMFPTGDSVAKMAKFSAAYRSLAGKQAEKSFGKLVFTTTPTDRKAGAGFSPQSFTFTGGELANMKSNMLHLFVGPLRSAIGETVGQDMFDAVGELRVATQIQSIFLADAFQNEIQVMLDKKAKDKNWHKGDFLTRKELDGIYAKMEHLSPFVKTPTQTFFIAGSESVDVKQAEFGSALNGEFRTPGYTYGPADAGVSGIPFMNIGTGDGLMMQIMSTMDNSISGTLKIFDGMNMPLDQLRLGSEQANQSVFETWMGNPMKAVHDSYKQFLAAADLNLSDALAQQIGSTMFSKADLANASKEDIVFAMQSLAERLNEAQLQIEARHNTLKQVNLSIDQMAAAGIPYANTGTVELLSTDAAYLAEQMNVIYEQELAKLRDEQPVTSLMTELKELGVEHSTGVFVLGHDDVANLTTKFPAGQAAMMKEIVESLAAKDYTVILGSASNVAKFNAETGREGLTDVPAGQIHGYTNLATKTIYQFNPSTETLVHELTHAATFEATLAHYEGRSTPAASKATIRLEALMNQFLELGDSFAQVGQGLSKPYDSAVSTIQEHLGRNTPQGKAAALNEFMAWTLANEQLTALAKRTKATKLGRLAASIIQVLKEMFGIKQNVGTDMFSNLMFNATILMKTQATLADRVQEGVLFQNDIYGNSERLTQVAMAFSKSIGQYLGTPVVKGTLAPSAAVKGSIMTGYRIASAFTSAGFNMTMQEQTAFHHMVTAMGTEAVLDANAMAGAQTMYAHVTKNLAFEDFMADPTSNNPAEIAEARAKYDVLMGKTITEIDGAGRSTLLPSFLALAVTNDEFRAVLAKIPMPKGIKNGESTVDAHLENLANVAMDKLGARMSSTNKAANVQEAIDGLTMRIAEIVEARDTFMNTTGAVPGGIVDRANTFVVDGVTMLSDRLRTLSTRAQRSSNNRIIRLTAGFADGLGAVINEQSGQRVSAGVMTAMNNIDGWKPFTELVSDVVGRTESNAGVYDLIKAVRSQVQKARQEFRQELPVLISKKFTRDLTVPEWDALHRTLGKTDLVSLDGHLNQDQILELLTDPAALTKQVSDMEALVKGADQSSFPTVQAKAKQLAAYMNTGTVGKNLLRNAHAIARLFGEPKANNWVVKGEDYTTSIDRLTTLYALQGMDATVLNTVASLVQEEGDGLKFTMSYLTGQRTEESRKASTGKAKANGFKGYIPSDAMPNSSILVADDTEFSKLTAQSYEVIGSYKGSNTERTGTSKSYYYAPVAARAGFEQGVMQNVRQSANGVDAATGFTLAQTAGRITEPAAVKILAARMGRENAVEALMPVYSDTGTVIAFERSLDPAIMDRIQSESNLAKSIGEWRGRQFEENMSQKYNETLVDRLHEMYTKDIAESASSKSQYVDLNNLGKKDAVLKDAFGLFNPETQAYIESVFGDEFMVRKDMLNDALGYRSASVGNAWDGTSRWSPATQKAFQGAAMAIMGNAAYKTLVNAENTLKNVVKDAKVLIVVKSVVVPMVNILSNMYQLASRGVPIASIVKGAPAKTAEIEAYSKSRLRAMELEADLRAETNTLKITKLQNELQSINDSHKRLSIWPLLEAGEFSSVSDAGMTRSEVLMTSGKLQQYIEDKVNQLPESVATLGRYALVTRDTALFQGLQKTVEYGDFVAKAILYDDLIKRQGKTKAEALGRVTEEFVNYDRLRGRTRGYLEDVGLLWFYNFKIRITKIALSTIRNNPVHAMLATLAPSPAIFGSVGLPTEDNMFTKLADGSLSRSFGWGQGLNAPQLNPWHNLVQ